MRVLVVDDDPDVLQVIEDILNTSGIGVTGAGSTGRARARLAAKRYDVLVIDAPMERHADAALAREAWADGMPVLMLPTDEHEVAGLRAAGLPFVRKPFRIQQLIDAIERASRAGAKRRENRRQRL
jgi:two-component system CheB/CheR fusion protein